MPETQMLEAPNPAKALNILCLDGGGCRGMILLHLVCQLLKNIEPNADVEGLKPCCFFDLICGTSTGALVAIMLGRLEMTLGEAFDSFEAFSKAVFQKDADLLRAALEGIPCSSTRLENAVNDLLKSSDQLMHNPERECNSRVSLP
jgi:predicted acylesterase/phospholipase RssA